MSSVDFTLELLLELDGDIYYYPSGHWHKIEIRRVSIDRNFPQGIKYYLTLHRASGERILGYDNAHLVPGDRYDSPFDHIHKRTRIKNYNYQNAEQLLNDFFIDVKFMLELEREYAHEI